MEQLSTTVQHYDWGDPAFIPRLQARPPSGRPEAELWVGAHARAPSRLQRTGESLLDVIEADPVNALGQQVAGRQGQLPFMMKVLAAAQPLSIQAHPSRAQAALGFAREDELGVPLDSPRRVYRDTNHKPEILCALTRFEAKSGFRPLAATRELFDGLGSPVSAVAERLHQQGDDSDVLSDVLAWLLRQSHEAGSELASATQRAAADAPARGPFAPDLAWVPEIGRIHPGDIGVTVVLLLHHVVLNPGEALSLEAGNLHSYLCGAGVELMANSDNVVRGGLSSKHVDVEALLPVVDCAPQELDVQRGGPVSHRYAGATADFALHRSEVRGSATVETFGPELLLVTDGVVDLTAPGSPALSVHAGDAVWVPAADSRYVTAGEGTLFRATVGT